VPYCVIYEELSNGCYSKGVAIVLFRVILKGEALNTESPRVVPILKGKWFHQAGEQASGLCSFLISASDLLPQNKRIPATANRSDPKRPPAATDEAGESGAVPSGFLDGPSTK